MEAATFSRDRATRMRALAETTVTRSLRDALWAMARRYDELAEDLEKGAKPVRHPDLLPEPRA